MLKLHHLACFTPDLVYMPFYSAQENMAAFQRARMRWRNFENVLDQDMASDMQPQPVYFSEKPHELYNGTEMQCANSISEIQGSLVYLLTPLQLLCPGPPGPPGLL